MRQSALIERRMQCKQRSNENTWQTLVNAKHKIYNYITVKYSFTGITVNGAGTVSRAQMQAEAVDVGELSNFKLKGDGSTFFWRSPTGAWPWALETMGRPGFNAFKASLSAGYGRSWMWHGVSGPDGSLQRPRARNSAGRHCLSLDMIFSVPTSLPRYTPSSETPLAHRLTSAAAMPRTSFLCSPW